MKHCLALMIVLTVVGGPAATSAATVTSSDAKYLDQLHGAWDMVGQMDAKPLHYHADGAFVLQGGFLRLHMLDAHSPPRYEAEVFIGFDPSKQDYIAHWIDGFGAAGARVVGEGRRNESTLVITFPYAEGAFRDTFNWDALHRTWSLLLESQAADGSWSTFASYTLRHPATRHPH